MPVQGGHCSFVEELCCVARSRVEGFVTNVPLSEIDRRPIQYTSALRVNVLPHPHVVSQRAKFSNQII